jgi:urease accessory protein
MMNVLGIAAPLGEQVIFASIVVVGGLLTCRKQLPLLAGVGVVAFFATFHGFALVGQGPHNGSFLFFAAGCRIAAGEARRLGVGTKPDFVSL